MRHLAQPVGRLDPVSAAVIGTRVFGAHVQGQRRRLPGCVKSKGVAVIVLQEVLKRAAELQALLGQINSGAAAGHALGIKAIGLC